MTNWAWWPGVGFVRAGEFQPEMLPHFGLFFFGFLLDQAQVVHPENAGLLFLVRTGLQVGGGGKLMPQKFRHKHHLQRFILRKREKIRRGKAIAHAGGNRFVFVKQRSRGGFPAGGGLFDDFSGLALSKFRRLDFLRVRKLLDEPAAQRLRFRQGEREAQPFTDQELETFASHGKAVRGPGGLPVTVRE